MGQRNWDDINNVMMEALNSSSAKIARSTGVAILGIKNSVMGVVAGAANELLSSYNDYKLEHLLKGLSTGLNTETGLNELYTYVESSEEKAISLANLFRKTINAECPKVCIIYGLILANHVEKGTMFTQDELIVCRALENATEMDVVIFKEIMDNYLIETPNGKKICLPEDFTGLTEFVTTCDWAVYNRIFTSSIGELENTALTIGNVYYEAKPATVLIEYINKARQIWDY